MTSSTLIYAKNQKRWQIQMRFVYRQVLWPACADISYIYIYSESIREALSLYRSILHIKCKYYDDYTCATCTNYVGKLQQANNDWSDHNVYEYRRRHTGQQTLCTLHALSIFSSKRLTAAPRDDTYTHMSNAVYMFEIARVRLS